MKDRQNTDDIADSEIELEPFDKPVETDPTEAVEEAEPYFPPTDPVVRTDHSGETRIAGGFGSGETPEQESPASSADAPPDEALEDLVHRALRLDASTAQLHLKVGVLQGLQRLVLREAVLHLRVGRIELWRGDRLWCGRRFGRRGLRWRDEERAVLGDERLGGKPARGDRAIARLFCVRRATLVASDALAQQRFERGSSRHRGARGPGGGRGCRLLGLRRRRRQ